MDDVEDPFRAERHSGVTINWFGPLPDEMAQDAAEGAARSPAERRGGGPVGSVRFTAEVARRVCERVESGESLRAISADPLMPHRGTIKAWRERIPRFAQALERARAAAGWHFLGGQKPLWCPQLARDVCARVAAGEALSHVCADPEMPSLGVVYRWRSERPEFAASLRLAREVRAERMCDLGWDIACEVTPENAYATRVKLAQLRWMTSFMAPRRFGRTKPLEAEVALETAAETRGPQQRTAVLLKHYRVEQRADGAQRMVTFVPDPRLNRVVRITPEDAPWEPAPMGHFKPSRFATPMKEGEV